ncbi:MAG TPA: DUF2147 domain-containing protein [Holosporales bacterium]|nr:DUF2147 domain-containing protein [Holosporales bacterium]
MQKTLKTTLLTLFALPLLATSLYAQESSTYAQESSTGVQGVWQTEKKEDENRTAHVQISNCEDNPQQLCGKIIALEEPIDPNTGKPKLDKKNPDETLRARPIMGVLMLKGFNKEDENTYTGGTIYSPRTGKTYDSKLELVNGDTLEVTGYILFFWKTQTWTRVKASDSKTKNYS